MPLKETNKVWIEGSENWKDAQEFEELKPFIIKTPPPLPNSDRSSKFIAKEIKINAKLVLLSLIIGICSYPVIAYFKNGFKSLSYRSEYQKLGNEFYGYEGSTTDTLTDEQSNSKKYSDFKSKRQRIESEISSYVPSEDIVVVDEPSWEPAYNRIAWGSVLDNHIKRSFGEETIWLSVSIFLLAALILVLGRYLLKGSKKSLKWINTNAKS